MRTYVAVDWKHRHTDEPVLIYLELDAERCELRKVELFRDGRYGYASENREHGGTRLAVEPMPALSTIARDPEFDPVEITMTEFEAIWALAAGCDKGGTPAT